ncbi:ATP-binding cassette sub-family A member 3 [Caerostris extrusa]|uniref:ATP-binding cassette sub-family A member 3 n=1 Tax=Caerostris extrusa TaxID=172846 RepID=A0AAV4WDS0_CAEEX|nr:ATP-binding cassette sub-family A member 3 [Caerostris extrusa]
MTFFELFIPCVCISLLFNFHMSSREENSVSETVYLPYDINNVPPRSWSYGEDTHLFYTPKSEFLNKVMEDVAKMLNLNFTG